MLDAATSQLGPLSLPTVALLPSSLVSISQCSTVYSVSLFMAFSHSNPCLFGSSFTSIDSPSVVVLGVPYLAST